MDVELKLTKSNGQFQAVKRELAQFSDAYLLCGVVVDVRETAIDGEFVIYIQPGSDTAVSRIELSVDFDPSGALIYDAGAFGYSVPRVLSADNPITFSRDFFMASNLNYDDPSKVFTVNLGFTSFEKIFTYFTYEPGRVSAVYNMEDRTVREGAIIRLESIMIDDMLPPAIFMAEVADAVAIKQKLKKEPVKLFGWTSTFTEKRGAMNSRNDLKDACGLVSEFNEKSGSGFGSDTVDTVIIDRAWQEKGSYSCDHSIKKELFSGDPGTFSKDALSVGLNTGIGYSPAMIDSASPHFKEYNYRLYDDRAYVPSFSDVYPMNLTSQDVLGDVTDFIKSETFQDGIRVIKLNDLQALICRTDGSYSAVTYQRDYSVSLFRKFLKQIRAAAADNTILIGSGPIGECAGVVDAVSFDMSGDIDPAASDRRILWNYLKDTILTAFYRSVYNRKLFRIYPEPLLFGGNAADDGGNSLSLTDDEAELFAVGLAFSGGAVMLGDLPGNLSQKHKDIISKLLPACGIFAVPLDFWEYPYCSHYKADVADCSVKTSVRLLFNFEDFEEDRTLRMPCPCFFIDMHDGKLMASGRNFVNLTLKPHSVRAVLVKYMPEHAAFLWCDDNMYRGSVNTSDLYFSDTLIVTSDAPAGTVFHLFVPYGNSSDIYINEHKLMLRSVKVTGLEEGNIYSYRL